MQRTGNEQLQALILPLLLTAEVCSSIEAASQLPWDAVNVVGQLHKQKQPQVTQQLPLQ